MISPAGLPRGYKAFGYAILTVVGGWALNLYNKPVWATELLAASVVCAAVHWLGVYADAKVRDFSVGESPDQTACSRWRMRAEWAHASSTWLMMGLLILAIGFTALVAVEQREQGVKLGFQDKPVEGVYFFGENYTDFDPRVSAVPSYVVVGLATFVQNTAPQALTVWLWTGSPTGSGKRFPWDFVDTYVGIESLPMLPSPVLAGTTGSLGKGTTGGAAMAVPVRKLFTLPAAPAAPYYRPLFVVFRVGHRDREKFLADLDLFPCCPCMDIALRQYEYENHIFVTRLTERSDCFPDMKKGIAEAYAAKVGSIQPRVSEVVRNIESQNCPCKKTRAR